MFYVFEENNFSSKNLYLSSYFISKSLKELKQT